MSIFKGPEYKSTKWMAEIQAIGKEIASGKIKSSRDLKEKIEELERML